MACPSGTTDTPLLSPELGPEGPAGEDAEAGDSTVPSFSLGDALGVPPVAVSLAHQGRSQTISGIAGIPTPMKNKFRNTAKSAANEAVHTQTLHNLRIYSGTANPDLAREIAEHLDTDLGGVEIKQFADGEIGIHIQENVRGKDIFLVQPTCPTTDFSVNDNVMQLLLLISTFRRSSAKSVTAVIPYYGYARQDRKMQSRVPISAADVARLIESMGVDRVVAVDLHCGQIQGFFSSRCPCDNLNGSVVAIPYFSSLGLEGKNLVVVSPDAGGVYRANEFRKGLKSVDLEAGLAMIVKQRARANEIAQMDLVGDVEGKDVIIVDDMIDTAGTLCKAGAELKKRGARRIFAFATHGLFNGPAIGRIRESAFEKVVVCNTIPLPKHKQIPKIHQLTIGGLLAKTIYALQFKGSVSQCFKPEAYMDFAKSSAVRSSPTCGDEKQGGSLDSSRATSPRGTKTVYELAQELGETHLLPG